MDILQVIYTIGFVVGIGVLIYSVSDGWDQITFCYKEGGAAFSLGLLIACFLYTTLWPLGVALYIKENINS